MPDPISRLDLPTLYPTWATDAVYTNPPFPAQPNKVTPPSGKRAEGFLPDEKPPAEHFNERLNLLYQWVVYNDQAGVLLADLTKTPTGPSDVSKGSITRATTNPFLVATGATLTENIAAGEVVIQDVRVRVPLQSAHAFTASKDTYLQVDRDGAVTFAEVAVGASPPSPPSNALNVVRYRTNATSVTAYDYALATGVVMQTPTATALILDNDSARQLDDPAPDLDTGIMFAAGGRLRWWLQGGATSLDLIRYDAAGVGVDIPFAFDWATGFATFGAQVVFSYPITVNTSLTLLGDNTVKGSDPTGQKLLTHEGDLSGQHDSDFCYRGTAVVEMQVADASVGQSSFIDAAPEGIHTWEWQIVGYNVANHDEFVHRKGTLCLHRNGTTTTTLVEYMDPNTAEESAGNGSHGGTGHLKLVRNGTAVVVEWANPPSSPPEATPTYRYHVRWSRQSLSLV